MTMETFPSCIPVVNGGRSEFFGGYTEYDPESGRKIPWKCHVRLQRVGPETYENWKARFYGTGHDLCLFSSEEDEGEGGIQFIGSLTWVDAAVPENLAEAPGEFFSSPTECGVELVVGTYDIASHILCLRGIAVRQTTSLILATGYRFTVSHLGVLRGKCRDELGTLSSGDIVFNPMCT